jgi:co-chaperonin GroES (HSP10)
MTTAEQIEETKKKAGRPKGAKNKPKVQENILPIVQYNEEGKTPNGSMSGESKALDISRETFENPSGIRPFEFKVLVCPDETRKVSKGGVLLPDDAIDMEKRGQVMGTIIELSPAAFSYHRWPEWVKMPKPGDHVYFARHAGSVVDGKDGVEYRMINDQDIGAVIDF